MSAAIDLPGPRWPVIVQTLAYGVRQVEFYEWCHRRYGDVFAVRLPGGAYEVVLADPAAIKEVMAFGPDDFTAAAIAPVLEPFLGSRSLLLLDGDRHKHERKQLVHSLHGAAMSEYADVIADVTRRDVASWPTGRTFQLHPRMQAITLDVIARLIFGADDELRIVLLDALRPWLNAGGSMLLLWEGFRKDLHGLSPWARFVRQRHRIDELLDAHIEARRADPRLHERHDALSLLLQEDEALDPLSMRDQLMTMLAAGHDTSATALGWAFALLLRHPEALERLVDEIDDSASDEYLDAVVKEVLRLTPVVTGIGRTLTHDAVVNGTALPAGVAASPSILLAQRRADTYPDPLAFRPERFLGRPADPHTWLPFGGGVRRCIGAAFATLEIKTVLRTVLATVELEPVGRMDKPRRRAVTMIPSHGTRVRVTGVRRGQSRSSADSAVSINVGSTASWSTNSAAAGDPSARASAASTTDAAV